MATTNSTKLTSKQRGDAAEHYVAGKLGLNGWPVVIMPDNWPDYDLLVSGNGRELKIQVKLVNDINPTPSTWAIETFNDWENTDFWAIVRTKDGPTECWVIPTEAIVNHHRVATPRARDQRRRWINWAQVRGEFARYQSNWTLAAGGAE